MAEEKDKPAFDEQTLGRLLEAAFVLQEHSEELRQIRAQLERKANTAEDQALLSTSSSEKNSETEQNETTSQDEEAGYSSTLAQIVDIQRQVQQLNSADAMSLVAEQVTEICGAAGAAVGLVNGSTVKYQTVAGIRTLPAGSSVPLEKALCFPCIRSGQVFSCPDIKPEILIDTQECKRRGIRSLIAVPVFHNTGIVGGLELYFSDARAFTDEDVHTCQLMAALVTEGLVNKKSGDAHPTANERPPEADDRKAPRKGQPASSQAALEQMDGRSESSPAVCYKCGHQLLGEEQFCGECGAARSSAGITPSLQSKVASLWHMQEAENAENKDKPRKRKRKTSPVQKAGGNLAGSTVEPRAEIVTESKVLSETALQHSHTEETPVETIQAEDVAGSSDVKESEEDQDSNQEPVRSADWRSALSAKEFFEQFAAGNRKGALAQFWNSRRGDIYLAIAVILVATVIGWGIRSNRPVKATPAPKTPSAVPAHKQPAAPEISLFDRMLISLGLAEAPQPPEYKGNPSTQVWEDLRTGLYYCPGTDMYGKTPKGKYTSQRDAQLDRFEPAYRRACD